MVQKKPFHEAVAEKLIMQLKAGTAPWQRPWEAGDPGSAMPINPTTGNRYKGINAIQLMSENKDDTRWLTYKQAISIGAQVKKGEKGTPVQYWKFTEEQIKRGDDGKEVIGDDGKKVKVIIKLERPRVFMATVFNAEQIEGMPPLERKEKTVTWEAHERAENILQSSGAKIFNSDSSNAFYRLSTDSIHLPEKNQFTSSDNYYATALHELGHWTGNPSRLDRDLANPFGSEAYAKEELRAEISSMIIGDELGIGHDTKQHAAYVGSWIKALQEDPLEIFRAAADAEKIQNYVLSMENKKTLENSLDNKNNSKLTALDGDTSSDVTQSNGPENSSSTAQKKGLGMLSKAGKIAVDASAILARGASDTLKNKAIRKFEGFKEQVSETIGGQIASSIKERRAQQVKERESLAATKIEENEFEQAVITARDFEEKVREDPNSTGEDISSAKELRKDAEVTAMLNDKDLQKSIKELEIKEQEHTLAGNQQIKQNAYIDVPYKEKDEAKSFGAKWDRREQSWYVPANTDIAPFEKWQKLNLEPKSDKIFLAVPYGEREIAKAAGAKWDKASKSWFTDTKGDMKTLERWLPDNVPSQQGPALTPREEFADALRTMKCVVSGEHPIMDGKKHRIPTEDDKPREKSGFYVGHIDGHPAGYIKHNRTGQEMRWKSKGYSLSDEQKAKLNAEAASKMAARAHEQKTTHEATAKRITTQMNGLMSINMQTPYLEKKGIDVHLGALTDTQGKTTFIPAQDTQGKVWTMQYINEDGRKRFAANSKKEGCFHVVGGMEALASAPALVVGEGYSTMATSAEALGFATVSAFDSGNLSAVVSQLHDLFPDKPVIVIGDDDKNLEMSQGKNPGREKAEAAAKKVGGKATFPIFASKEIEYPSVLPPVTLQAFRNKQLSEDQTVALNRIKKFTDFNDMATKSELGMDGVKRQLKGAVSLAIKKSASITEIKSLVNKQEDIITKKRAIKIN